MWFPFNPFLLQLPKSLTNLDNNMDIRFWKCPKLFSLMLLSKLLSSLLNLWLRCFSMFLDSLWQYFCIFVVLLEWLQSWLQWLQSSTTVLTNNSIQQSCKKYFPFWETGKNFLRDKSIVYNSLYTICNRSADLFVENVHW